MVVGQSNAVGRGTASGSPSLATDEALEYRHTTHSLANPLDDPVLGNGDEADTGSAWPSFCETYIAQTSRVPTIIGSGKGGSGQFSGTPSTGSWDTDGTLRSESVTFKTEAETELQNGGITPTFRGILWHQGEQDAVAIDNGDITKAQYKSALESMIQAYRDDFSDQSMPFWIFELGQPNSGDTAGYQDIRDAQNEVATADADTHIVSTIQKNFPAEGKMGDDVHYNQTGYNEMGTEGATNIAQIL